MHDDHEVPLTGQQRRRRSLRWIEYVLVVTGLAVLATGVIAAVNPKVAPTERDAIDFVEQDRKSQGGSLADASATPSPTRAAPVATPTRAATQADNVAGRGSDDPDDLSGGADSGRACPASPPAPTGQKHGAWAKGSRVHVYRAPGAKTVAQTLKSPTRDGMVLVMLVRRVQGDWLHVQISQRPNGSNGWIHRSQVNEYTIDYHAVVELCRRRMTLYDYHGRVVMREPVATGSARYPTPTGRFFVDYQYKTPRPSGAYGPWLLSISGFSNVLKTFAGGIGQIAFHGTNRPASVGKAVSHGCLRMRNDAITRLQKYAIPGTPVDIYA